MFEYNTEKELHEYIINHFNDFFNFKYKGTEVKVKTGKIDIVGEDEENSYIIEVKRDKILPRTINQIKRYMLDYHSDKNIIGIVMAPDINKKATLILENELNIRYVKITESNNNKPCYINKTLHFTKDRLDTLEFALQQSEAFGKNFSDYIIDLIREKELEGIKLPQPMEERIIELIKIHATTIENNTEQVIKEVKEEFDPDAKAALDQFG